MGECINLRRGGKAKTLPILNANYPLDKSLTFIRGNTASATFEVKIATDGYPAEYTYQWYVDNSAVSGATGTSYTWSGTKGGTYSVRCDVTNKAGTVQSRTATLSAAEYYTPVLNTSYPADITSVRKNATTTLKVTIATAGNPTSYTYQWYVNGQAVSGATSSSYNFSLANNAGTYDIICAVTNGAGTVWSRNAVVTLQSETKYLFKEGEGAKVTWNRSDQNTGVGISNVGTNNIRFTLSKSYYTYEGKMAVSTASMDLSIYKTLKVEAYTTRSDGSMAIGAATSQVKYNSQNWSASQTQSGKFSRTTISCDISSVTSGFIGIYVQNDAYVYNVWLES